MKQTKIQTEKLGNTETSASPRAGPRPKPPPQKKFALYKKRLHPEATMFARDIGVQDVIFESDSRIACHALADPTNAPTSISTIVAGTSVRLHEFRTFGIAHVRSKPISPHMLLQHMQKRHRLSCSLGGRLSTVHWIIGNSRLHVLFLIFQIKFMHFP